MAGALIFLVLFALLFGPSLGIGHFRKSPKGKLFRVERHDRGDAFEYWSEEKNCTHYNGYEASSTQPTPDCNTTLGCCCYYGFTFYTPSGKCEWLYDERSEVKGGKYRFDRSGLDIDTGVSTMQAYFAQENEQQLFQGMLVSTTASKELPVVFEGKDTLGSCTVTDINIIHYCRPKKLPQITAKLKQNGQDKKYYLRLESIPFEVIPTFYGELLQVAINCSECGADYLFFKVAGKTILSEDKRFLSETIPHYDPVNHPDKYNCPDYMPAPQKNTSGTNKRNAMIYAIVGAVVVCIVVVAVLTGYYKSKRKRRRNNNVEEQPLVAPAEQRQVPVGEERLVGVQPQPQPPGQPPNLLVPRTPTQVTFSSSTSTDESTTTRSTRSGRTSSQSASVHLSSSTSQASCDI